MRLRDRLLLLEDRRPRLARALLRVLLVAENFRQVGRRSMQRFTLAGKLLLGFYCFSLAFVVDTRATMNYQLFALLLCALFFSFFLSLRVRQREGTLQARRLLPRVAMAGTPLEYDLLLHNPGPGVQRSLEVLESLEPEHVARFDVSRFGKGAPLRVRLTWRSLLLGDGRPLQREARVPDIPPGKEAAVRITAQPPRRGVLRFSQSAVATPDPLGIFRSFSPLPAGESLLVLPHCHRTPRLPLPGGRRHQPGGLRMASSVGEDGEFTSLREYRRGDPLRHIHWRSWARHGKPIVKEYQEEFFTRHGLVLDTFPDLRRVPTSRDAACFEAAVSVAASLAAAPMDQDALLDLLFVGDTAHCVTSGRGLGSADQLLEILAGVAPSIDGSQDFGTLTALVSQHAPMLSGCVCILLGWDEARAALLRELESRGLETLPLVLPMPGRTPQKLPAGVRLLDPETIEEELARL